MKILSRRVKNIFTRGMAKCWEEFLRMVVESLPLEILKTQLDKLSYTCSQSHWSFQVKYSLKIVSVLSRGMGHMAPRNVF